MLPTQVEYWKLVETKRHNTEMEAQGRASLAISEHQAQSARIQAISSTYTSAAAVRQAENAAVTASANLAQAETAARNAATNEMNARTNAENAATNARNAEINERNATTREYEAVTGRIQANAATVQAQAAWENATTNRNNYYLEAEKTDFNYTEEGAGFKRQQQETNVKEREVAVKEAELGLKQIETFSNPNVTGTTQKKLTAEIGKYESEAAKNYAQIPEIKASTELKNAQVKETKSQTAKNVVDTISKAWNTIKGIGSETKRSLTNAYNKAVERYYTSK